MANKITKREVIGMMMNEEVVKANPTYVAYLENELALLDKKAQNKKGIVWIQDEPNRSLRYQIADGQE